MRESARAARSAGSTDGRTSAVLQRDLERELAPHRRLEHTLLLLTIGALGAIHERGLRIPDDIALAAYDEMDWMYFIRPALTVVAQPTYELGRTAVNLLLQRMDDPDRPPQQVVLPATVHIRESSQLVA